MLTHLSVIKKEINLSKQNQDLKKAGLKVTMPRLKILEIFENSKARHLSADEVYKNLLEAGIDVGLATVYRVLTQFESAGLIKRHNFEEDRAVFELDEGEHHDHLICVRCNGVEEFVDEEIENRHVQTSCAKFIRSTSIAR